MGDSLRQLMWPGSASVRELLSASNLGGGSLRDAMAAYDQPVVLTEKFEFEDESIGGEQRLEFHRDGWVRATGHMRATGWTTYQWGLATRWPGEALVIARTGTCHGFNQPGDRQVDWDERIRVEGVAAAWPMIKTTPAATQCHVDGSWWGAIDDVLEFIGVAALTAYTGGAFGLGGYLLARGLQAADIDVASTAGIPGLVAAGGAWVLFGPSGGGIVAVLAGAVIGGAAGDSIRHYRLTDRPELVELTRKVYGDTIDCSRVVITDLQSTKGTEFTGPGLHDVIVIGMGDGFYNPAGFVRSPYLTEGSIFIHEMGHVWQMQHGNEAFVTCTGLWTQRQGREAYNYGYGAYGSPSTPWEDFNTEQKAQIVSDWFQGHRRAGLNSHGHTIWEPPLKEELSDPNDPNSPKILKPDPAQKMSPHNPYYHFITDNILIGKNPS